MIDLLWFVVFELDVQALLDADLHLDGVVHVRVSCQGVHQQVQLLHHVRQTTNHRHAKKVSEKEI